MSCDAFHPTVKRWFEREFGLPSAPQRDGWPAIASGRHTLIAAPTGSGKTLAAFLHALDSLLREGDALPDETRVLYVSPLKALGNDVQKNLLAPLASLRALEPSLPGLRVAVRSGDTPPAERQAMLRRPPHVLVTTPESAYVLLTSEGGVRMLRNVTTVIVDEIHAIAGSKRGSHLALSLERLCAIAGEVQRIGLSATQRPIERVAELLVGAGRSCQIVDAGHLREIDLAVQVPDLPLSSVCSDDHWTSIHDQIVELIGAHRTTLIFSNTRKLAERLARRLADTLGDDAVTAHHGSLAKDRRLDAERRLKAGELRALVATASLELGIDIGDVDLVVQIGVPASIATLLQRVGRAGHRAGLVPKGRLFPLTEDELVVAAALTRAVRCRDLDALRIPEAPLDVLAQQLVAACVQRGEWPEAELFDLVRRAWPYRDLDRARFDAVVDLHAQGRLALLHRDRIGGRLLATKRARLPALSAGGAIPDRAEYQVVVDPEGLRVGSVEEDFAIESTLGDVFQLGNTSWRIVRIESGTLRVVDAQGAPPSMPFWFGEAPARSDELVAQVDRVREDGVEPGRLSVDCGLDPALGEALAEYLREGRDALGATPTATRIVLERFFDESGGSQLVVHAPFGSRINRAFGLALRKRFCRGFGFELQAAANDEAILLSLGPMHAFPLEDVFEYLHPQSARALLVQAVLGTPLFTVRWRWNVSCSLLVPRTQGGRRLPAPLMRMRADDALAAAFPQALACGENLPPGDLPVPLEHPLVRQTIDDCLHDAMDVEGFLRVVSGLRDGSIDKIAVDRPSPSPFARGILNAKPYMFLDDAPLEERRSQAVATRGVLPADAANSIGALDPDAVARVRAQAWPRPESAEEVHEALSWMGYIRDDEARRHGWSDWLEALAQAGRVRAEDGRWFASEASREPVELWRGRLEALGPIDAPEDDPALLALEAEGVALRVWLDGRRHWCHRRHVARIHRDTLDRLRARIEPVSIADFVRFASALQHATPGTRVEGPAGIAEVLRQLSGLDIQAAGWEPALRARLTEYRSEWIDRLTLAGEFVWLRLFGSGAGPIRCAPICLLPRSDLASWLAWRGEVEPVSLTGAAASLHEALSARGASFTDDLLRVTRLLPSQFEAGLAELVGRGLATVDSFAALRALCRAPSRRPPDALAFGIGRIDLLRGSDAEPDIGFVLDRLLDRWGVVCHRLLQRERLRVSWRDLLREARLRELRGTLRGGYFIAGTSGEQFARPESIPALRAARDDAEHEPLDLPASDPLNLTGILTPSARVSTRSRERVTVG